MKNDLTEIVCVVDQSSSMRGLTDEVIDGINTFVKEQQKLDGDANFTLILFDSYTSIVHNGINLNDVPKLDRETYRPNGMTAMNDGIALGINTIGAKLNALDESERAGKVIFAIMTDGYENASNDFTAENIKDMINHQTDKYGWEFIFMAANIDLNTAADAIGIRSKNRYSFDANARGVNMAYASMAKSTTQYRSN